VMWLSGVWIWGGGCSRQLGFYGFDNVILHGLFQDGERERGEEAGVEKEKRG